MSAPGAQKKRTKVKLISPCGGRGNQKGIPPSADGGQPARLDRAGPQARTRLSPTRFIRARRENKDSDLRALGGNGCSAKQFTAKTP